MTILRSRWTHACCRDCYALMDPGHIPLALGEKIAPDPCCWCGAATRIFFRADPASAPCGGDHERAA